MSVATCDQGRERMAALRELVIVEEEWQRLHQEHARLTERLARMDEARRLRYRAAREALRESAGRLIEWQGELWRVSRLGLVRVAQPEKLDAGDLDLVEKLRESS